MIIENIVKDCLYFLILALLLLVGFSLALFIILHSCNDNEDDSQGEDPLLNETSLSKVDDEKAEEGSSSFSAPYRAVLTMFYAMVGTFEPEASLRFLL